MSRPLDLDEYQRYGRQMIMPECGLQGQVSLKHATVGVVGAGGLGCPVLQYLAGAGVGVIHVFDLDTVSVSNLHRQVLHGGKVGMSKALSAKLALKELNPHVEIIPHGAFTPANALNIKVDVLVDCTDRPLSRYLLNDAAVRLGIPLVSGAAIAGAGQWAVYGSVKGKKRACYRCLWPEVLASPRCEDIGVWGFITGMVGSGMAMEVIKILLGIESEPLLHLLHMGNPLIRTVKMRPPSPKCSACCPDATITNLEAVDYDAFCPTSRAERGERITAEELAELKPPIVIDTRPAVEFGICSLPDTTNMPLSEILASPEVLADDVVFICRQGNDSQIAAAAARGVGRRARDVIGGLRAWSRDVDQDFPVY